MRRQYSGHAHGVIKGIGVVNLVYYNPHTDQFWALDYRVFDSERNGKSKLDHVNDMLDVVTFRGIAYKTVKLHGFAGATHLKLFRVALPAERTEYIVTNDVSHYTTAGAQQESARRWKVEQFHREEKQLTGIERCECRLPQ